MSKPMSPSDALRHAKNFDETLRLLEGIRTKAGQGRAKWAAIALIHAGVFFLGRHEPRHQTYDWLQRICDDLVLDKDKW